MNQDPLTGGVRAYFIPTQTLPAGTVIGGFITLLDDNSSISFTGYQLQSDYVPGQAIFLPAFSDMGDVLLVAGAALDYTVTVDNGKTTAVADGIVALFEPLSNTTINAGNAGQPVITGLSLAVNNAKDLILQIKGSFPGGNPTSVVLSDQNFLFIGSYVIPAGAMTVSGNEIDVDLSQIAGLACKGDGTNCLSYTDDMLVTVSQGFGSTTISDTAAFRYGPPPPGTFNPAPNLQ